MTPRPFLCIELLNTFSKKELDGLTHLISCPYFNTDTYAIKLLKALKKHVLGKEIFEHHLQVKVYIEVFVGLPVPKKSLEKKQRSLLNAKMSILIRLAEQFLSIENMDDNEMYKYKLLYKTLLERKQFRLFNKRIKADKHTLNDDSMKDEIHHYKSYQMERSMLNYLHQNGKLPVEDNLNDIIYHLDIYYLLNKQILYNTALSLRHTSSEKEHDFDAIKSTISPLLNLPQYANHPIAMLFNANTELLETSNRDTYLRLLDLLDTYASITPPHLLRSFYATANVYCASQIGFGHLEYIKDAFDLYKIMHEKNLLIDNNFISIREIKNMITVACRVGKFDWAKQVLEHYRSFIQPTIRESAYQFNLGVIAFHQRDYETAHDKFIQVDKINTTYDINVRVLILKCLYEKETEYSDATIQAFNTTKKFFKNHKSLTKKRKNGYTNFIQILIYLYAFKHNVGKMTLERIKQKLEAMEIISDKGWLLEKISELE